MKIAYIAFLDISYESGVLKKIIDQSKQWRKSGCEVCLFFISSNYEVCDLLKDIECSVTASGNIFQRFSNVDAIAKKIREWQPDVLYIRYGTYYPQIETLQKIFPSIIEVNSNTAIENKLVMKRYKAFYHKMTGSRILKASSGIVCVTQELAQQNCLYNKPIEIISNGIDLSQIGVLPPAHNEVPHLVFIGSPFPWQGVDIILRLAEYFPDWHFDIIGYNKTDFPGYTGMNVAFHGYIPAEEYKRILRKSDLAFGPMALSRKNMREACPLKVREYMALGIPTIISYFDTDLSTRSVDYILQLDLNEDICMEHLRLIKDFVAKWKEKRISQQQIKFLDSFEKEKQRLSFIYGILKSMR